MRPIALQLRLLLPALVVTASACTTPPAPPVQRESTSVAASYDKTWTAVIDVFADRNIPIRTLDRSSGLVVADDVKVGTTQEKWADCGSDMGIPLAPTDARYNVRVRGDSTSSTVKITARWVRIGPGRGLTTATVSEECGSTGVWESTMERNIKARAEGTLGQA